MIRFVYFISRISRVFLFFGFLLWLPSVPRFYSVDQHIEPVDSRPTQSPHSTHSLIHSFACSPDPALSCPVLSCPVLPCPALYSKAK